MGKFDEYVNAYERAIREAENVYSAAIREAENVYSAIDEEHGWGSQAERAAERVRRAAREEAHQARNKAYDDAWDAMEEIPDPVAKWIVANCKENKYEAIKVLPHLPAPLTELDDLADDLDFCGVWDRYRLMALRAGVFAESKMTAERAEIHSIMRENLGTLRGRKRTKFDALLDAVVKAEITARLA